MAQGNKGVGASDPSARQRQVKIAAILLIVLSGSLLLWSNDRRAEPEQLIPRHIENGWNPHSKFTQHKDEGAILPCAPAADCDLTEQGFQW